MTDPLIDACSKMIDDIKANKCPMCKRDLCSSENKKAIDIDINDIIELTKKLVEHNVTLNNFMISIFDSGKKDKFIEPESVNLLENTSRSLGELNDVCKRIADKISNA